MPIKGGLISSCLQGVTELTELVFRSVDISGSICNYLIYLSFLTHVGLHTSYLNSLNLEKQRRSGEDDIKICILKKIKETLVVVQKLGMTVCGHANKLVFILHVIASPTTAAQMSLSNPAMLRTHSLSNADGPYDPYSDTRFRNSSMSLDEKSRTMSRSGSFRDGFEEGQ